jgi:hypothetical protein
VRLPQTNATLTAVAPVAVSEDYDQPEGDAPAKWTGGEAVYFSQRRERVEQGNTTSVVVTRAVIVPADLGVDWQQGDTVTLTYRDETVTGAVRAIERHQLPVVALGTVRLTLEDQ